MVEKIFSSMENNIAPLLSISNREALEALSVSQISQIKQFIHYQSYRTVAAAQYIEEFYNAAWKDKMKAVLQLNKDTLPFEMSEANLDLVRLEVAYPQDRALSFAVNTFPLILDLDMKFLTWEGPSGFILSDHPVVHYNQFLEHHPDLSHCKGITGLAVKGLQIFLPVSSHLCVALFDPTTYMYGSGRKRVCNISKRDLTFLNQMQAISANQSLFFSGELTKLQIDGFQSIREKHPRLHTHQIDLGPLSKNTEGKFHQFNGHYKTSLQIGAKFTFVQTIERKRYPDYLWEAPPLRIKDPIAVTAAYRSYRNRGVAYGSIHS